MEPIVKVKNLKKYFTTPKGLLHAVDGVSFEIHKGKTLGIVGESGCGKSTTGKALLQVFPITEGEVIIDGMDTTKLNKEEMKEFRRKAQLIFQDPYASLNPRKTVSQIIEEPLIIHKLFKTSEERERRVKELMKLVGLSERLYDSYPHELDGGRRQRVVIARAISINPKFIVCDEPVSALDVSIQAQILNLLQDLQEELGITYMFITHDLSVVKHISDEIIVMYLGEMVEKADADTLFESPTHPYTQALLSAIPIASTEVSHEKIILQGEIFSPISPGPECRFSARCPFAMERCRIESPKMKEINKNHEVSCHRSDEIRAGKLKYETAK